MTHSPAQDSEQVAYLESVFRFDPADQIEDVLALRNNFLAAIRPGFNSVEPESTIDGRAVLEQRAQVQQQLEEIRRAFWKTEPEQTRARLDQLDVDESPDLKLAVNRIRNALAVFDERNSLRNYKWVNHEFAGMVEDVLIAAPRDAGRIQQTLLLRISEDDWMRRQSRRMVKFIRKRHPLIAKLEMEWFDEILRTRVLRRNNESDQKAQNDSSIKVTLGGVLFGLLVFVGIVISAGSPGRRNQYQQGHTAPRIQYEIPDSALASPALRYLAGERFDLRHEESPQRVTAVPQLGFDDGVTSNPPMESDASTTSKDNFDLIERLSQNGKTARSLDDNGATWPPRPTQRFDSFLDAEKKTEPPPRNNRGTKKSLPMPPEPYDSIPADSILKEPIESQPQNQSLIFR